MTQRSVKLVQLALLVGGCVRETVSPYCATSACQPTSICNTIAPRERAKGRGQGKRPREGANMKQPRYSVQHHTSLLQAAPKVVLKPDQACNAGPELRLTTPAAPCQAEHARVCARQHGFHAVCTR